MKKTLALVLVLCMALFAVPSFALTLETPQSAQEITVSGAKAPNAELSNDWMKPGLNAVNEQAAVETFEGLATKPATITTASFSAVELATADGNTYLRVGAVPKQNGDTYPHVYLPARLEKGRKYYATFRIFNENAAYTDLNLWFIGSGGTNSVFATYSTPWGNAGRNWYTLDDIVTYRADYNEVSHMNFQFKIAKSTTITDVVAFLIDDFAFVPYYRFTYLDHAGETVATEQALFEAGHDKDLDYVITAFTPTAALPADYVENGVRYHATGWATEQGGAAVSSVNLANTDVTFHAVYEAVGTYYTYPGKHAYNAKAGTVVTVTAIEDFGDDVTVDVGATDAAYTVSGDTVTVTAAGKPGSITVTNTFEDGYTASYTVNLYGGGSWKPGVNSLTGTTDPFTFEDYSVGASYLDLFKDGGTHWVIAENPLQNAVNASSMALRTAARFNYFYPVDNFTPAIEADRPISYTYKRLSNAGGYVMVNQSGYQWGNLSSTNGAWVNQSHKVSGNPYTIRSEPSNKVADVNWIGIGAASGTYGAYDSGNSYFYIDDIAFTPYYKITYKDYTGENVIAVRYDLPANGVYTVDNTLAPEGYDAFSLEANTVSNTAVSSVTLANEDITLYATNSNFIFYTNGEDTLTSLSQTVPSPADLGLSADHFLLWLDEDGSRYFPGDSAASLAGKTLTAFCQDASMPAMGLAFNGEVLPTSASKASASLAKDGLRTVIDVKQTGGQTWDSSKKRYMSDARLAFRVPGFDADEYTVFRYVYKPIFGRSVDAEHGTSGSALPPAEIDEETMTNERTNGMNVIFYWTNTNGDGYYNGGEHRVGGSGKNWEYLFDGAYRTIEVDMSNPSNSIPAVPWNATGSIYGISIDPLQWSNWSGETLIDSVRVYRGGHTVVSYYDGDTLLFEETGRGVGTGYCLNDNYPEKEGCLFAGWADENGNLYEDGKLDLTGDTSVYAKFVKAPVTDTEAFSVKLMSSNSMGLRFRGTVEKSDKTVADEYGFLISTAEKLNGNALTFDLADGKYVKGAAFIKGEKDLVYAENDETVTFTAACYGIPAGKYDVDLYARTYLKTGGFTFYGETAVQNIKAQAQKYASADPASEAGQFYALHQDAIDAIIANA